MNLLRPVLQFLSFCRSSQIQIGVEYQLSTFSRLPLVVSENSSDRGCWTMTGKSRHPLGCQHRLWAIQLGAVKLKTFVRYRNPTFAGATLIPIGRLMKRAKLVNQKKLSKIKSCVRQHPTSPSLILLRCWRIVGKSDVTSASFGSSFHCEDEKCVAVNQKLALLEQNLTAPPSVCTFP